MAMSEEVRQLISGLEQADDVNRHWQVIDRWVAERNDDCLRQLAVALLGMMADTALQRWQPGSLLDRLRRRLASTPGRWSTALLFDQLVTEGTPARQLRETAARLAGAQKPQVIIAALEEHEGHGGVAEFLYVLTHEAVLRRKIDDSIPVAMRLAARTRREGHPLARLPLRLFGLETDGPVFVPDYRPPRSSSVTAGVSGGWEEERSLPPGIGPVTPPTLAEVTTPKMADLAASAVRTWIERSNGRYEARMFESVEPIPVRWVCPSSLRSLRLESLAGADEQAVCVREITPRQGFGYLFSAAATGGAYTWGEGGAYGRLAAWESVAALTGCAVADMARASAHAECCSWFSFWGSGGWFFDVAWDIGLAVLRPDRRSLAVLAATDTD
jgi:hypothetical protein